MKLYRNPDFWLYVAIIASILVAVGLAIKYFPKTEVGEQQITSNTTITLGEIQPYYPTLPETITPEQAIEIPTPEVVYKYIYIDVPKPVYASLRDFTSTTELSIWLSQQPGLGPYQANIYDCDDYARDLQRAAEMVGYRINFQTDKSGDHFLNSVVIGNDVFLIEPQTKAYWHYMYLDDW